MELLFPVFVRLVCAICRIFANFAHETREVTLFRLRKRDIPVLRKVGRSPARQEDDFAVQKCVK